MLRLRLQALFSSHAKERLHEEHSQRELRRTESQSSYMQQRRKIYVNMKRPVADMDDSESAHAFFVPNRVRTAKYTPLTFIPKNLFEQFRNVANLYFLFLVILQCIPLFGVTEPAVSALPLIFILLITAIKDAIEDWKRNQSDQRVNSAKTLVLSHWVNVNAPPEPSGMTHKLHVAIGFFSALGGLENYYSHIYRVSLAKDQPIVFAQLDGHEDAPPDIDQPDHSATSTSTAVAGRSVESLHITPLSATSPKKLLSTVRHRSDTFRSELNSIFKPGHARDEREFYRPGLIPHSVLYRVPTEEINRRPSAVGVQAIHCADFAPGEPPAKGCKVWWKEVQWQDVCVGDYVMIRNDDDIPADIVVLSTSETDDLCYIETQNLDGETNLKVRQGLRATSELRTVHDCERAQFYIESEPPHANIYQYNGVLRWNIEQPGRARHDDGSSDVMHRKTEAITYNNLLLRGCVLRNTRWVIGMIVYTGDETKIMLNSGRTPSKRSKMAKATNPHVIANFGILAVLCIVSSVLSSIYFYGGGSARFFDFGIEGSSSAYLGFITFWVTLILYQNIVPISLYISVEIVKTLAAFFIFSDIDMYHEETDTPCVPRTWNISDDLGQIEYIFSDKTGTLTQNVMEFRKCTINGVSYGLGVTDAMMGAAKREHKVKEEDVPDNMSVRTETVRAAQDEMYELQRELFTNTHVSPNPTFADPKVFEDLSQKDTPHATALEHFFTTLALCHTVMVDIPDPEKPDQLDYKAQSPDEAALVGTARDLGFVYLGRESSTLTLEVMGEKKTFQLLNVLEFTSSRKRMSIIVKPNDGSGRIVLLCKGADSVIYERLCNEFGTQSELEKDQAMIRETTSEHLEKFATEGLRTLCLAYRFISPEEYRTWNRRYEEASASIRNREDKIEEACEQIELDMLLMGGTAIEDRLQVGVPETIAELSRSGIKLWVLTGDKTETAINIGYACNLIVDNMTMIVIRGQSRDDTLEQLKTALEATKKNEAGKRALVIDGVGLKYGLEPECKQQLLELAMSCNSVICCRVSPKQKAQVVRLVKKGLRVMTLAIGDGANDVSMIQEAHVGIGISGVEGRQAVMASDYAIAQFRFLQKLLLVHGRWSYLRTAEMIFGFFFKNIVWTFVLFWYQIFCQFNGTMMFDYSLVTLYNLIFTSLPIIFLGIWDQDLSANVSLAYPELYRMGIRNDVFKVWQFWLTVCDAIYQSSVCFFFPYMLLLGTTPNPNGLTVNGVYENGTVVSSITVIVANLFVATSLCCFTWIQVVVIFLSILVYYAFVGVYSCFNTFIFAGQVRVFGNGLYWLTLMLTIVACFIPRMTAKLWLHQYKPFDNDIIRELVLILHRGRT